jgi:glycosyltransferase involved in cell wall biosynthesis
MVSGKNVTVVIPTAGNREKFLLRSILSATSQSVKVSKIIVVWDGEKDPFDFLYTFGSVIEVLVTPKPYSGVSMARQLGIERASTELIGILDDDDYWSQDKIFKQLDLIRQHDNLKNVFIFGRSVLEYEDGSVKAVVPIKRVGDQQSLADYFFSRIAIRNSTKTCSSSSYLFSRQLALDEPFKSNLVADEDTDFILRISNRCKVFYCHEILVNSTYRDTGGSGLSHSTRNIDEWFDWLRSLSGVVEKKFLSNIKVVYGVRHYLKKRKFSAALKLWFATLFEGPDLISAVTGASLFLRTFLSR